MCAYFFGFLGGALVVILERKNLFSVFHGWQSMVVGVLAFVVQILFVWSKTMYRILWVLYLVFTIFMLVRVLMDAPSQRLFKCKSFLSLFQQKQCRGLETSANTGPTTASSNPKAANFGTIVCFHRKSNGTLKHSPQIIGSCKYVKFNCCTGSCIHSTYVTFPSGLPYQEAALATCEQSIASKVQHE